MKIHICAGAEEIGKKVALIIAARILVKPDIVLGMATGSTPLPAYRALIEMYEQGAVDFSLVRSFNLDEYVGIGSDHGQSYHSYMRDNLFSKINIKPENARIPDPVSPDLEDDCRAYDAAISEVGGIDLQLLGLGANGHIGFNEPCGWFSTGTHVVELAQSTIDANKRFFGSALEVPRTAISMGIGSRMRAKEIILIAPGRAKAEAVMKMTTGKVEPSCPASILQLHPAATAFFDEEAAAGIPRK
jgi:glucosamine-6-phosphate deaminase